MFIRYLQDHPHLICDRAANFLVIWCIDLQVEEVIYFYIPEKIVVYNWNNSSFSYLFLLWSFYCNCSNLAQVWWITTFNIKSLTYVYYETMSKLNQFPTFSSLTNALSYSPVYCSIFVHVFYDLSNKPENDKLWIIIIYH